jgi:hypothetical protein
MLRIWKFDHTQRDGHRQQRIGPNGFAERCACIDCIGRVLDIELVEYERDIVYRERLVVGQANDRGARCERRLHVDLYRHWRLRQSIGDRNGHIGADGDPERVTGKRRVRWVF